MFQSFLSALKGKFSKQHGERPVPQTSDTFTVYSADELFGANSISKVSFSSKSGSTANSISATQDKSNSFRGGLVRCWTYKTSLSTPALPLCKGKSKSKSKVQGLKNTTDLSPITNQHADTDACTQPSFLLEPKYKAKFSIRRTYERYLIKLAERHLGFPADGPTGLFYHLPHVPGGRRPASIVEMFDNVINGLVAQAEADCETGPSNQTDGLYVASHGSCSSSPGVRSLRMSIELGLLEVLHEGPPPPQRLKIDLPIEPDHIPSFTSPTDSVQIVGAARLPLVRPGQAALIDIEPTPQRGQSLGYTAQGEPFLIRNIHRRATSPALSLVVASPFTGSPRSSSSSSDSLPTRIRWVRSMDPHRRWSHPWSRQRGQRAPPNTPVRHNFNANSSPRSSSSLGSSNPPPSPSPPPTASVLAFPAVSRILDERGARANANARGEIGLVITTSEPRFSPSVPSRHQYTEDDDAQTDDDAWTHEEAVATLVGEMLADIDVSLAEYCRAIEAVVSDMRAGAANSSPDSNHDGAHAHARDPNKPDRSPSQESSTGPLDDHHGGDEETPNLDDISLEDLDDEDLSLGLDSDNDSDDEVPGQFWEADEDTAEAVAELELLEGEVAKFDEE